MAAIGIHGLVKRFGKVEALKGVELTVAEGHFTALLGPSGCGKTTMLRLIAGLESATEGRIEIGGRDVTALPPEQRNVGLMFQSYALFPHMTVADNLRFPLRMRRNFSRPEQDTRIRRALELVRLENVGDRLPKQLSGGQQQRIAFVRALIDEPDILLLDEPLSNLDARLRDEMQVELVELRRQIPITTVMVTHDQNEGLSLADEIILMRDGRIEQSGTPAAVYANPATPFVADFLGAANLLELNVSHADGVWVARLPDGSGIAVPKPADGHAGARTLMLRQEHVLLGETSLGADVRLQAKVAALAYRGQGNQIVAEFGGGQRIRLNGPASFAGRVGDPVLIGWRLADSRLY